MRLAFLGAGRMATALAAGLTRNGIMRAEDMVACDISDGARSAFTRETGVICTADPDERFGKAECVLLAVKPQNAADAVHGLHQAERDRLLISIAAGVPLGQLEAWLGSRRVIRVMPNTPLLVGKGASVYSLGAGCREEDRAFCQTVFGSLGIVRQVHESWIDAVTALSGSGPAYFFEMVQALVEAAVEAGLPAELASELTVQTLDGAAAMLQRRMGTPDELRRAVTSPGGTTAAGLAVLEAAGFRDLIRRMLTAARDRSIELGRMHR